MWIHSGDKNMYKDAKFEGKIFKDFAKSSNKLLKNTKTKGCITEKNSSILTLPLKRLRA